VVKAVLVLVVMTQGSSGALQRRRSAGSWARIEAGSRFVVVVAQSAVIPSVLGRRILGTTVCGDISC
jgi:hypothetical protein